MRVPKSRPEVVMTSRAEQTVQFAIAILEQPGLAGHREGAIVATINEARPPRGNPWPDHARCPICRRKCADLVPFGEPGDPVVGDFQGVPLVKTWRPFAGVSPEQSMRLAKVEAICPDGDLLDFERSAVELFGEEEGTGLAGLWVAANHWGSSWECRECVVLSERQAEWKARVANGWQPSPGEALHNDIWNAVERHDLPPEDVETLLREALEAVKFFSARDR